MLPPHAELTDRDDGVFAGEQRRIRVVEEHGELGRGGARPCEGVGGLGDPCGSAITRRSLAWAVAASMPAALTTTLLQRARSHSHQCEALGSVTAKSEVCADAAPRRVSATSEVIDVPSIAMVSECVVIPRLRRVQYVMVKDRMQCNDARECQKRVSVPVWSFTPSQSARVKRFTKEGRGGGKEANLVGFSLVPTFAYSDTWFALRTLHGSLLPRKGDTYDN